MQKNIITILFVTFLVTVSPFALDSAKVYTKNGGKALIVKDYQTALKNYQNALRFDSNNFEAIKNLGVIYSATGDQKKAKEYFLRAYQINNKSPYLCNTLGVIYSNEGNNTKAIEYYRQAIKLDTTS
ncbi:MAG: tetratricopeptide repeat protein, partial [FCB group bacterium]|nr:tetratricopeptide repeat protein [FCB group bacterium]